MATQSERQADQPQKEPARSIDPAREVVFEVESLQCPAVKGVGCGSILWPLLTRIDQVEGVSRSFSNWTGTRLRISVANDFERNTVAERVRDLLVSDDRHPKALSGTEFTQALRNEQWRGAARLIDLSSYEFRTIARRRIQAFADRQNLDAAQRDKLTHLVDDLWDKAAQGLEPPGSQAGAYRQYWRARLSRFVGAYVERARDFLTPGQVEPLLRQYQPPSSRPSEVPEPSGGG